MEGRNINGYDFDGVVSIGINPASIHDVIITGRTFEEAEHVNSILKARGIMNPVYFNPITLKDRGNHSTKSRTSAGEHKAVIIDLLKANNVIVKNFFEDDEVQASIIKDKHPLVSIVHVVSDLVTK